LSGLLEDNSKNSFEKIIVLLCEFDSFLKKWHSLAQFIHLDLIFEVSNDWKFLGVNGKKIVNLVNLPISDSTLIFPSLSFYR
jgi:hypothetical protein